MPHLLETLAPAVFAGLVIVAAIKDLASFTIPNWISAALALAFVPAVILAHLPLPEIGWRLAVGFAMLVAAIGMFALGWIGGGDAKLAASASLWLYPDFVSLLQFLFVTALAGGALAVGLVALRSAWLRPIAAGGPGWTQRLATPGAPAPYGVAIAIGALVAFAIHPLV